MRMTLYSRHHAIVRQTKAATFIVTSCFPLAVASHPAVPHADIVLLSIAKATSTAVQPQLSFSGSKTALLVGNLLKALRNTVGFCGTTKQC